MLVIIQIAQRQVYSVGMLIFVEEALVDLEVVYDLTANKDYKNNQLQFEFIKLHQNSYNITPNG